MKNVFVSMIVAAALCLAAASAFAAKDMALTTSDVEKIVHDYIQKNPQLILDSVNDFQRKSAEDRQKAGMAKNKSALFKDANSPEAGNPDGDVTVVEFFDYNCHYCKGAFPVVKAVLEKDKKVRFIFKDFPILGPSSEVAAKWALAAQKQKKYYAFHGAMMDNKQPIDDELLASVARSVGMDVAKAKKDIEGTDILLQIEKNRALASGLSINGTPAFIIGDDLLPGAVSEEDLLKRIADARSAKKK